MKDRFLNSVSLLGKSLWLIGYCEFYFDYSMFDNKNYVCSPRVKLNILHPLVWLLPLLLLPISVFVDESFQSIFKNNIIDYLKPVKSLKRLSRIYYIKYILNERNKNAIN